MSYVPRVSPAIVYEGLGRMIGGRRITERREHPDRTEPSARPVLGFARAREDATP